jgi:hypothetical protein
LFWIFFDGLLRASTIIYITIDTHIPRPAAHNGFLLFGHVTGLVFFFFLFFFWVYIFTILTRRQRAVGFVRVRQVDRQISLWRALDGRLIKYQGNGKTHRGYKPTVRVQHIKAWRRDTLEFDWLSFFLYHV